MVEVVAGIMTVLLALVILGSLVYIFGLLLSLPIGMGYSAFHGVEHLAARVHMPDWHRYDIEHLKARVHMPDWHGGEHLKARVHMPDWHRHGGTPHT